jgi:DNA-binding CsgD family transcriptional regulator
VSGNEDRGVIRRCIDFGASGFIPKTTDIDVMREAIRSVLDGGTWTPSDIDLSAPADRETADMVRRLASLTPQQVRVLMMLSEGLLNKQIAYELSVSEATVKAHVSAILQKLGVESRTQAVIAAARIATKAEQAFAAPPARRQCVGDVPQGEITHRMAVLVIDGLEVVDVQQQQVNPLALPPGPRHATLELFLQPIAQGQACQGIEPGGMGEIPGLEMRQSIDHGGLVSLEGVEIGGLRGQLRQETCAEVSRRIMHAPVVVFQPARRLRIDGVEVMAGLAEPAAELAPAMGVGGEHVPRRGTPSGQRIAAAGATSRYAPASRRRSA